MSHKRKELKNSLRQSLHRLADGRPDDPKKVVVIGGGTGTFTVLSGLKKYPLDLTAIVTVADSGGSAGILRDEFGYLPVGDFRMALVALADDSEASHALRELFLHRFNKGNGLKGHNFGNLFLVALTDIWGSEEKAIEVVSKILRVRGKVLPVSNEKINLAARYANGKVVRSETHIDEPSRDHDGTQRIIDLWVEPKARITPKAKKAIKEADLIVFGPGDLYTSILANIVIEEVGELIKNSLAKIAYISNLMTKYGQTHGFSVTDHLEEIAKYSGRYPDYVLLNEIGLPHDVLDSYKKENEYPVRDDLTGLKKSVQVVRGDFLASKKVLKPSGDMLRRSLIRHDSDKLAKVLVSLL